MKRRRSSLSTSPVDQPTQDPWHLCASESLISMNLVQQHESERTATRTEAKHIPAELRGEVLVDHLNRGQQNVRGLSTKGLACERDNPIRHDYAASITLQTESGSSCTPIFVKPHQGPP